MFSLPIYLGCLIYLIVIKKRKAKTVFTLSLLLLIYYCCLSILHYIAYFRLGVDIIYYNTFSIYGALLRIVVVIIIMIITVYNNEKYKRGVLSK